MAENTDTKELEQLRRENCRKAVRAYLVDRIAVALHPRVIQRRITEGFRSDFTEEDVTAALAFLVSDGQVVRTHDAVGATAYYQATSKGALEHERSGA